MVVPDAEDFYTDARGERQSAILGGKYQTDGDE
jgi:hypothetical protein